MRKVFIAGNDRTDDIKQEGFSIERVLTFQEDSLSFTIKSGAAPTNGDEIVVDNGTDRDFGGIIYSVRADHKRKGVYHCAARDYTVQLDRKMVVMKFENTLGHDIFLAIVRDYCPGFSTRGVIKTAPIVEAIQFDYLYPSECFKLLCEYLGWHWKVDYYKDLKFFSTEDYVDSAPMQLVEGAPFRDLRHDVDTIGLANKIYVLGGKYLSNQETYRYVSDGVQRIWVLPHEPRSPWVSVQDGPDIKPGLEYVDEEANYNWMYNLRDKYIRLAEHIVNPSDVGLVNGATLAFKYKRGLDVITVVEDQASQQALAQAQGGDGIYEYKIVDDALITLEAAEAAGNDYLREHGNPRVKGSFISEYVEDPEFIVDIVEQAVLSRDSVAYKKDGLQVSAGYPRFEPSLFNLGMHIEKGTNNLIPNSSFELYTGGNGLADGWYSYTAPGISAIYSIDTVEHKQSGSISQKITLTGGTATGSASVFRADIPVIVGKEYSISGFFKGSLSGAAPYLILEFHDSGGAWLTGYSFSVPSFNANTWEKSVGSLIAPANAVTAHIYLQIWVSQAGATGWLCVDDIKLEDNGYSTTWQPYGLERKDEIVTVPTAGVFYKGDWTVELTYRPDNGPCSEHWNVLWQCYIDTWNWYELAVEQTTGVFKLRVRKGIPIYEVSGGGPIVAGTDYQIMASGDGSTLTLAVNGVLIGTTAYEEPFGYLPTNMYIGCSYTEAGAQHFGNGIFDDLRISDEVRTLAEHQTYVSSGTHLPTDEHTTYHMFFNDSLDSEKGYYRLKQWMPGQVVDINLPERGIVGQYLIRKVKMVPMSGSKWSCTVEYGGKLLGLAGVLKALVSAQQNKKLAEVKSQTKFVGGEDKVGILDEFIVTLRTDPWYCGDADAICGEVICLG